MNYEKEGILLIPIIRIICNFGCSKHNLKGCIECNPEFFGGIINTHETKKSKQWDEKEQKRLKELDDMKNWYDEECEHLKKGRQNHYILFITSVITTIIFMSMFLE